MTELDTLRQKCYKKDGSRKKAATDADFTRLKQLQDGEPLSAKDLEEAERREAERTEKDKADFKARQEAQATKPAIAVFTAEPHPTRLPDLDPAPEHPRIVALKEALLPFTQLEANDSRPDDFVLVTRDVSITAGDVRKARKAMKL